MPFSFCASILVFGASTAKLSTTARRSWRASSDRMEAMPARNILRFTFWVKFSSGEFGKIRPPPRHSGEELMPARARPVPFWRNGLAVVCVTVARSFWARLPRRAFAWKATTIWCTRASLKSRPNRVSEACMVAACCPDSLISLSSIALRLLTQLPGRT